MHNFRTNGNFSKYLSLTYSFRLKINDDDSLSAMLQKFIQSTAENVYTKQKALSLSWETI